MTSCATLTLAFPPTSQHSNPFWTVVRNLPALCDRELVACDIHWNGSLATSACVARFASPLVASRVVERVVFWAGLYGGTVRSDEVDMSRPGDRLTSWKDVRASLVPLVADAFAHGAIPHLFIDLDCAGAELVRLDVDSTNIFIGGAIAPPLGDSVMLGYTTSSPSAERSFVNASVTGRMLSAQNGALQGFLVEVAVDERFAEWAAALPSRKGNAPWHRREQRIPVRVSGVIAHEAGGAELTENVVVENVSRSGALVTCGSALPAETAISLTFPLGGAVISLRGTVVRNGVDGMGIRFDRDPFANLRLAVELERLTAPSRRALVIDDDALARSMVSDSLEQRGFDVTTAPTGEAGVRALHEQGDLIDAVITDVCMPGLAGEELVRTLRAIAGRHDVPIIGMTATATAEAVRRIEAAGVDVVLFKSAGAQSIAETAAALARSRPVSVPS